MRQSATKIVPLRPPAETVAPIQAARSHWEIERRETVDDLDRLEWDSLAPRDMPHLRWGFLAALERSGQCRCPQYLMVRSNGRLRAIGVLYHLSVDLLTLAPRRYTRGLNAFRTRFAPNLLYLKSLTCGPIVTNCRSNVYLSPELSAEERVRAAQELIDAAWSIPKAPGLALFFEFSEPEAVDFEPAFTANGFLKGISLPGTRIDVKWNSIDDYVARMRKAFRRTVLKDRAAAESLTFEIVDDFSEIADEAWALYKNVLDRADYVLQELSQEFFRHLATVEESRLVVARDRKSGRMVGIELLLCGETVLQDVFTGLDYSRNAEDRLYFNLLYPVIDHAGRQGFQQISLGQTSYTFKARLGVSAYPLWIFVRHRNPIVQRILTLLKPVLFTETPTVTYKVFRDENPD